MIFKVNNFLKNLFHHPWFFRILVGLIFLGAASYGLYHVQDSPAVWFDEGIYLHVGRVLAEKGIYNFEVAPGQFGDMSLISVGFPLLFPLAFVFKIFGSSLLVGRILAVCFLLGLLAVSYCFLRKITQNKWFAVAGLSLLASFSALYGHGKNVLGEVPGLFYLFFSCYFLFLAEKSKWNLKYVFWFALFLGLCVTTKPIFLPMAGAILLALILKRKTSWPPVSALVLALVVGASLLGLWFWTQHGPTTSFSTILSHYSNPYNDSQLTDDIKTNLARFVREATPIHFLFVLLVILVYTKFQWKRQSVAEFSLVIFACLIWLSYLRTPGWYRYFFPGHVVALALFPGAVSFLTEKFQQKLSARLAGVIITALFLIQAVYLIHAGDRFYDVQWRQVRSLIQETSSPLLFYNVPEGAFFAQKEFFQVLKIRPGLYFGETALQHVKEGTLIIARGNVEDLETLKKQVPGLQTFTTIGNYYIYKK